VRNTSARYRWRCGLFDAPSPMKKASTSPWSAARMTWLLNKRGSTVQANVTAPQAGSVLRPISIPNAAGEFGPSVTLQREGLAVPVLCEG